MVLLYLLAYVITLTVTYRLQCPLPFINRTFIWHCFLFFIRSFLSVTAPVQNMQRLYNYRASQNARMQESVNHETQILATTVAATCQAKYYTHSTFVASLCTIMMTNCNVWHVTNTISCCTGTIRHACVTDLYTIYTAIVGLLAYFLKVGSYTRTYTATI